MKHNLILVGATILALLAGFWGGHEWEDQSHPHAEVRSARRIEGQLTSPLLGCVDEPSELSIGERAQIEKDVNQYINAALTSKRVSKAAVYFRDLNNGPWFGIHERELYTPGSLLKLPIAISLYYRAAREPGVLDTKLTYSGVLPPEFAMLGQGNEDTLVAGEYSVHDLIGYMLRDSSNAAASLLVNYQNNQLPLVFQDLGIDPPVSDQYQINVKTFGAFFRILYNASYLDQPASEEVLSTLTKSTFNSGLVAGVPENTKVSHKFGTRILADGTRQLHDCGIVYANEAPYILCIMSQGDSANALEQFIAGLSKIVYEGVAAK